MIEHKDACENSVIFINITSIWIDIFERSFLSKHMADTSKNNLTTSMVESFRFKHLFAKVMDGWKAPNLFFIHNLFCFGRWIQHRFHNSEPRIVNKYSFDGPRFLELIFFWWSPIPWINSEPYSVKKSSFHGTQFLESRTLFHNQLRRAYSLKDVFYQIILVDFSETIWELVLQAFAISRILSPVILSLPSLILKHCSLD